MCLLWQPTVKMQLMGCNLDKTKLAKLSSDWDWDWDWDWDQGWDWGWGWETEN